MSDIVERAQAALEGVTEGGWLAAEDNCGCYSVDAKPDLAMQMVADQIGSRADAEFIAQARQLVPDLVAEVERLRDDLDFYSEWSNDLTRHIPEEFDDDIAQEAIISHWASSISSEVQRLREQIRQMRRQTELFMDDGDRNRLTVALAVSDE